LDDGSRTAARAGARLYLMIVSAGLVCLAAGATPAVGDEAPATPRQPTSGSAPAPADEPAPAAAPTPPPAITERVQVTATRVPESTETVPASVTIVSRDDLLRRGARDLPSALALVAGVSVASGGDGGPTGSVPELWGLREFDAFLLTVDGIPWGGAFNPALPTLDLNDVERIEVLRGAAPVMYGATSFVGVINVIRRTPGDGGTTATVSGGSYGSGGVTVASALPQAGGLRSTLDAEATRQDFSDDRARADRGLLRWRALHPAGQGLFRFNVGGIWQRQDPASPRPRDGTTLTPLVPVDSNNNMLGARLDENRYLLDGAYERPLALGAKKGEWSTTLSLVRSDQDVLRGFLTDLTAPVDNANGFRQAITTDDLYFDTHIALPLTAKARLVAGIDDLYGAGEMNGGDFDYTVGLDGSGAPEGDALANQSDVTITDRRQFAGLYGQLTADAATRWHFEIGVRLNRTAETRRTSSLDLMTMASAAGSDSNTVWRGGGYAGATFTAWKRGDDALRLFADYRNTYKPAAIDFGLDADPELLSPETGESWEAGVKGLWLGGRLDAELTAFRMDLTNIVVSQNVGGIPTLENAGQERLRGLELGIGASVRPDLRLTLDYSLHDASFIDYLTEFGGVPTQLAGNTLEMSARQMASVGVTWGRATGWRLWTQADYTGSRWLNKRNTAPADAFTTWDAGVGYRFRALEVRLDAWNLTDRRDPVAESELGDAQYYLTPAPRVALGLRWTPGS
jgi:outer membrane receptor protein involved in Fe transport